MTQVPPPEIGTTMTTAAPVPVSPMQAAMAPLPDQQVAQPLPGQVDQAEVMSEAVFSDYFGFDESGEFTFPDGVTKIWFRALDEGGRARFQRETNRDVQLERGTGNARIKTDPAGERNAIIMASVTGWNLHKKNPTTGRMEPVTFSNTGRGSTLAQWLDHAQPKIIDSLEEAIRKLNPWLVGDMSLEDIDREIDRLKELREEKIKLEAEKDAFRA